MSELVKDPVYWEYLQTKPSTPRVSRDKKKVTSPPWVVYVQQEADGKWGRKSFWKYKDALEFMQRWLERGAHDAALNNRRLGFNPPQKWVRIRGKFVVGSDGKKRQAVKLIQWKPKLSADEQQHHWCKYCRRPTLFKYYSRHRFLGTCDSTVPRCCICGASARIAILFNDHLFRRH